MATMMKKASLFSAAVTLAALALPTWAADATSNAKPPAPNVVATVNGENITREELVDLLLKQYGSAALARLIDQTVLEQATKKQGIEVTQKDLDIAFEAYKDDPAFQQFLARVGKETAYEQLRQDIIRTRLGEKLANVPADQLGDVRASHILITPARTTTPEEREKAEAAALKEAQEVLAEVKKPGADFAALAKKHSDDQSAQQNNGDLGYFNHSKMVKPFADAAFAAKPGEIVGPVKSDFGYHIIKVVDHRSYDKLPAPTQYLYKALYLRRTADSPVQAWMTKQKQDADIKRFPLVPEQK